MRQQYVSAMQFVVLRLIATTSGLAFLCYIIIFRHVEYTRWMLGLEVSHACLWKVPS